MTAIAEFPTLTAASESESASLCIGESPALRRILGSVVSGAAEPDDPDAVLIACEGQPGGSARPDVPADFPLTGRVVGLIVVALDAGCAAATLAELRGVIRRRGGIVVGTGVCLDASGVAIEGGSVAFADVTDFARLALLAGRVRRFARNRRVLRAG